MIEKILDEGLKARLKKLKPKIKNKNHTLILKAILKLCNNNTTTEEKNNIKSKIFYLLEKEK